jgi:hypothetical protein
MTVAELIEAVRNMPPPTAEQMEAFAKRMDEREAEYAARAKLSEVTTEMLNRTYTL